MFLTEWNQEKVLAQERRDSIRQGIKQGINQEKERVATDMLRENYPLSAISKISKLSEEAIRKIANNLGIAVM